MHAPVMGLHGAPQMKGVGLGGEAKEANAERGDTC